MNLHRLAIKVIWLDGSEEYLKEGDKINGKIASFTARSRAEKWRSFILEGISDEVQSINIVPYPSAGTNDDTLHDPEATH